MELTEKLCGKEENIVNWLVSINVVWFHWTSSSRELLDLFLQGWQTDETYLVPKLRHFLWPGMNFCALATRIEPIVLAGDRFKQVKAGMTASTLKDSLELLQDEELGADGDAGSSFSDFLKVA